MAASCALARPATDARARRTSPAVASSAASRARHSSCGSLADSLGGARGRAVRAGTPGPRRRPARRRGRRGPRRAPAVRRRRRRGPERRRRRRSARASGAAIAGLSPAGAIRRLAEAFVREPADRRQRLGRLRPLRHDDQLVAVPGAEGGDPVQASRADRSAPVGRVGDGDRGVEAGRGAHQQRGRPGVEAERVAHRHPGRLGRRRASLPRPGRRARGRRRRVRDALAPPPPLVRRARCSSLPARPPRAAAATASSRSPRPAATAAATAPSTSGASVSSDRGASLLVQQVDGQLGGEDGAPEVHQDQHAVVGPHVVDRAQHPGRVRPERACRLVQPAGGADAHVRARHLRGQLGHALREPGAVADDDEADHGYAAPASANVAAAASSSSHDEVAPGSWWPALRSPR